MMMTASIIPLPAPGLRERSDQALVRLVQSLPHGSGERDAACAELAARYQPLVRYCADRYRHSPEPAEELMQSGYVGLLKAINNFDPAVGRNLAAYAQPCISGEIKRHFRDKRWQVHVKRSVQELRQELRQARAELTQRADLMFQARSLDAPLPGEENAPLADLVGALGYLGGCVMGPQADAH
jgi:DNA-directed RNA polymerase specialized sigma subunit